MDATLVSHRVVEAAHLGVSGKLSRREIKKEKKNTDIFHSNMFHSMGGRGLLPPSTLYLSTVLVLKKSFSYPLDKSLPLLLQSSLNSVILL